jgi:radical SAM protein with 4Fe4S-binding SPASM domain
VSRPDERARAAASVPPRPRTPPPWLHAVQRGHAPNCSSAGSAVGWALTSAVGAAVVLNAFADRFLRWLDTHEDGGPPGDPDPSRRAPDTQDPAGPAPGQGPPRADALRVRMEADAALIAWPEPPALLHVDRAMGARALRAGAHRVGPAHGPEDTPPGALSAPTEAHLAVTDRCPVACTGCYLSAGPDRPTTEPEDLLQQLDALAAAGVLEVAFGGGEALLRADLPALAAAARDRGLVPNLTTSGFGLTARRARELASLMGQVNVSLDGVDQTYRDSRGWDGAGLGLTAIRRLAEAGARVGVNTVLTRPLLEAPQALEDLGAAVAAAGAQEWQWLRFKPTGRGAEAWDALSPTPETLAGIWPRALALERATDLTIRWDCALVPFLTPHLDAPDRAARLGVHGCPGGERLWARSASGDWAPCSFAPGAPAADLDAAWRTDAQLQAWRDRAASPPAPCAGCDWAAVCRGGCRVVAAHLTGDAMAADPQCPRVRAHARPAP